MLSGAMEEKSSLLQPTGNPVLLKYERREEEKEEKKKKGITSQEAVITKINKNVDSIVQSSSGGREKESQGVNKQNLTVQTCVSTQDENQLDFGKGNENSEIYDQLTHENKYHKICEKEEEKETDRMVEEKCDVNETARRDTVGTVEEKPNGPDGGWGWIVLAGSFVVMLLVSTVGPCFTLVFSPLLHDLGTSPSTIFWIISTFSLVWNLVGPTVGPLMKEFGYRSVAMVGSILVSLGIIVSAFATSSWFLFFFFSLLGGLGAGILVTISNLIIPVYFTQHLGRANGILMTGTPIGLFTAPHLITFLQERYTYLGATLILGGMFLNTCLSAAVFHPVRWHIKRSECQGKCASAKDIQLHPSELDVESRCISSERQPPAAVSKKNIQTNINKNTDRLLYRVCRSSILSLKILYSPPALIIALSGTLTMNGYLSFLIMVPFVVEDLHSVQGKALCISVAGACNFASRLVVSALTDCKWFDMRIGYIVGIFIIALTNLAFPFLTSLRWMVVVMGVWGCGVGAFMGLYNLVMIKYMGIKSLPSMFGAASLLNGLGFITIGPLLGWIKEKRGSYDLSIWILAAIECLCIFLWIFMPAAVARKARNPSSTSFHSV